MKDPLKWWNDFWIVACEDEPHYELWTDLGEAVCAAAVTLIFAYVLGDLIFF